MKKLWIDIRPWDKALATAALESGADAVWLEAGDRAKMLELGRMAVAAPDGDLQPGRDFAAVEIAGKADEERAAREAKSRLVIVSTPDWTIIPLENLVAQARGLMAVAASLEEVRTALGVLERGVDGVVLKTKDPALVRQAAALVQEAGEQLGLVAAKVTGIKNLAMGDRVCIDTCTQMEAGQGLLVGNSSAALLLVHAETEVNPYVEPRPFRVNAGGVHAYVRAPGGKTRYLSELKSGDEVLVVNHEGRTETAIVGRVKIEKRPLLLVKAATASGEAALVLQNAETIRLVAPGGRSLSVAKLQVGDEILAFTEAGGRHFGMKVDETIREK